MSDISIERYSPEYKEQVLNLLSYHWGDLNSEERRKRFEWRYENNPYTESPFCYLAFDGENLIGFRAFVAQKFKLQGKSYYFGTPADAIVHIDYRRQGIFSNLTEFAFEDMVENEKLDFFLSLSSNVKSTKGNIKAGFEPFGKRDKLYSISFLKMFKNLLKSSHIQTPILFNKNEVKIEITDKLRAKEISRFMQESIEECKITNVRDEEFYRWRFSNSPKDYIFIYITKDDDLVGYLSIDNSNEKIISIMEYGYLKLSYLEELIKELLKNTSAPYIFAYVFTRSDEEQKILSKSGFRDRKDWLIKLLKNMNFIVKEEKPGALIKPISKNIKEEDFFLNGKDVRDPDNWSLFKSDVH